MFLKRLEIHNYKSLRNVVLEPGPLSVFVGPNAAGKSNLADALEFLALAYRWDLERAVANKGGFENIRFRGARRTQEPIRFRAVSEVLEPLPGLAGFFLRDQLAPTEEEPGTRVLIDHRFECRTLLSSSEAAFSVAAEELVISWYRPNEEKPARQLQVVRTGSQTRVLGDQEADSEGHLLRIYSAQVSEHELLLGRSGVFFPWWREFVRIFEGLRVFLLNSRSCRETGVPTPDSDLSRFGGNLPAVVAHLKKSYPQPYQEVLESLRRVLPSLEDINTNFTHTRTLGLFLQEKGVRHPWTSEEISDGTIQSLTLLVATFDPRIPLLVIEEPENSVHPWALRNLVEAFRRASETKQILLTTHSPILIDQLQPDEIWVVQRPDRETRVDPLLSLDPGLKEAWGQGRFTLSEYLDSGAVPAAVPTSDS